MAGGEGWNGRVRGVAGGCLYPRERVEGVGLGREDGVVTAALHVGERLSGY